MTKKENRGGPRIGSGAKPKADKKTAVFAWVLTSEVDAVGGRDLAKTIAQKAIRDRAKKTLKIV